MSAGERRDDSSRDAPQDASETRRRYPADEVSRSGRWMQRAGGVALFPEARDEHVRRLPSSRGCHARSRSGPPPSGTLENETSRAGLRPDGVYVYAERSQGRANRPFLEGEHGCPDRDRTMSSKPAQHRQKQRALSRNTPRRGRATTYKLAIRAAR